MTLKDIQEYLSKLTEEELNKKAVCFDYSQDKFLEFFDVCLDGEPPFHFTVN